MFRGTGRLRGSCESGQTSGRDSLSPFLPRLLCALPLPPELISLRPSTPVAVMRVFQALCCVPHPRSCLHFCLGAIALQCLALYVLGHFCPSHHVHTLCFQKKDLKTNEKLKEKKLKTNE